MRKVKFIVNPNADLGRAYHSAADLRPTVDELGGADWAGTVYPTHAMELARLAAEEGYELVIAGGGDGTVHEVVNGLMQVPKEKRPKLGIVPLGSGNDFSHSVGVDPRPEFALRQVFSRLEGGEQSSKIDIALMKDDHGRMEYFDNTLGIGFDTVVTIRSRKITLLRGFMMYLTAVIQTIVLDHHPLNMQISTDAEQWQENLLMMVLCNGPREGGGFHVAPEARNDDGLLHYAAIRDVSRLMMFRLLPEVMKGTHGRFKEVRMGHFRTLHLKSDKPLVIHTDGEIFSGLGSDVKEISVEILPGELEILK